MTVCPCTTAFGSGRNPNAEMWPQHAQPIPVRKKAQEVAIPTQRNAQEMAIPTQRNAQEMVLLPR